jgi:hypothetical protein
MRLLLIVAIFLLGQSVFAGVLDCQIKDCLYGACSVGSFAFDDTRLNLTKSENFEDCEFEYGDDYWDNFSERRTCVTWSTESFKALKPGQEIEGQCYIYIYSRFGDSQSKSAVICKLKKSDRNIDIATMTSP